MRAESAGEGRGATFTVTLPLDVLRGCGAHVRAAADAQAALTLVAESMPEVLVSDIGMPDVDGFELIRRIRRGAVARGQRLHAIALTAFTRHEDERRALDAGFDGYLRKPVEVAAPLQRLAALPRAATLR